MLDCPTFDSLNQIVADSLPMEPLINNKTANLHPIIRLHKLRENAVNPAY
jgi:hypothetical protein